MDKKCCVDAGHDTLAGGLFVTLDVTVQSVAIVKTLCSSDAMGPGVQREGRGNWGYQQEKERKKQRKR